jgi:FkbM family methyltransferase
MDIGWAERIKTVVGRNLPSQKPQLWENFALAVRRRVQFEVGHRMHADWLDRLHVVELSRVGFDDGQPPLRMEVMPREVMNKALFLYGTFEISETRLFQSVLRPGMTFIDVGANIGYYTLLGGRMVGPSGAVHAFEPNPAVRERLSANVALNGLTNVDVEGRAMTRTSGTVRFYVSAIEHNSGISSIVPNNGLEDVGREVPCVSLDDFAASLGGRRVDVLKMDIEGAELDVIEGGRGLLDSAEAPVLLFESFKVEPLLEALTRFGYHVRRLHYTLEGGLELPRADEPVKSLFDGYESPNYFASKDPAVFDVVVAQANVKRSATLRWLGRI